MAVYCVILVSIFSLLYWLTRRVHLPLWLLSNDGETALTDTLGAIAAITSLFIVGVSGKRKLSALGFPIHVSVSHSAIGYLIAASLISIVSMTLMITHHLVVVSQNKEFNTLFALWMCLAIAVFEETVFRGFMLQLLEKRWGTLSALVVTAMLFGAVHYWMPAPVGDRLHFIGAVFVGLECGLLFGAGYIATRALWLPIGMHWAWNFFESSYYGMINDGMHFSNTFLLTKSSGPVLLTGGSYGPEASIITLFLGLIATVLLLQSAVRSGNWRLATNRSSV